LQKGVKPLTNAKEETIYLLSRALNEGITLPQLKLSYSAKGYVTEMDANVTFALSSHMTPDKASHRLRLCHSDSVILRQL